MDYINLRFPISRTHQPLNQSVLLFLSGEGVGSPNLLRNCPFPIWFSDRLFRHLPDEYVACSSNQAKIILSKTLYWRIRPATSLRLTKILHTLGFVLKERDYIPFGHEDNWVSSLSQEQSCEKLNPKN